MQLSLITQLHESHEGARDQATALAFDDNIAHLIRPVLDYFKGGSTFDGIDFSASIHPPDKTEGAIAAEYIFNFPPLRCYAERLYRPTTDQLRIRSHQWRTRQFGFAERGSRRQTIGQPALGSALEAVENVGYLKKSLEWRNWQTHGTQKPNPSLKKSVTPSI